MRLPHRCNRCRRRFVLKRKHTEYTLRRRCPHCGSFEMHFDTHSYHRRLARRALTCWCSGEPYPHRRASTVWCDHHPTGPTEEDYEDRYADKRAIYQRAAQAL